MESNIYNYEMIRAMMKSPKRDILPNDVLIYKNGEKAVLYIYNDDYTIIEVLRPHYERIYDREKAKNLKKN